MNMLVAPQVEGTQVIPRPEAPEAVSFESTPVDHTRFSVFDGLSLKELQDVAVAVGDAIDRDGGLPLDISGIMIATECEASALLVHIYALQREICAAGDPHSRRDFLPPSGDRLN